MILVTSAAVVPDVPWFNSSSPMDAMRVPSSRTKTRRDVPGQTVPPPGDRDR